MEEKAQEVQQDQKQTMSEFSQKVEELTRELMELTAQQKGNGECGLIVIMVNEPEENEKSEEIVSITGSRYALVKGICDFARRKETKHLFSDAVEVMTMASLKKLMGGADNKHFFN